MKKNKLIIKIFSLVIIVNSFSQNLFSQQAGRIKISFIGAICNEGTWDDALQLDGKGDEIFANFHISVVGNGGVTKFNYNKLTKTYGDNTASAYNNRVNAGNCVDFFGNAKGGLKSGDEFACNEVIGEYDLAQGDIATIVPILSEFDPGTDAITAVNNTLQNALNTINSQVVLKVNNNQIDLSSLVNGSTLSKFILPGTLAFVPDLLKNANHLLGEQGTRPIGMTSDRKYTPQIIVLNAALISKIVNSNIGYGLGVLPIQYNERALGNSRDHGNYTLKIKIEFWPTAAASTPPPPPPPPPPPTNTGGNTMGTTSNNDNSAIVGTWEGTWGNGSSDNPNFYSFKFNADRTMQLLDANGNAVATGTYTFGANVVEATYRYNGGAQFSAMATLNGLMLYGSWGSGTNSVNGGRWKMSAKVSSNPAIGYWVGTWGSGSSDSPNYYSFKLNTDGTMRLIDANGAVTAEGTYTVSGATMNATYKYGNGSQYSASATISGQTMSGTWGSGADVTNGGRWKMNKN
jgi:hypothetical protein